MTNSKIEWTEKTWNPTTGCTKVSAGCKFCYAEKLSESLQRLGNEKYAQGFKLTLHPESLDEPLKWKKPAMIFVNSMSDLFHEEVPLEYILKVFDVMQRCPQHTFQILTKRIERALSLSSHLSWHPNVWMGTSIENRAVLGRMDVLRQIPAAVRFVSVEPLLEDLGTIDLTNIDWVIVGGESGSDRKMEESWVLNIKAQCEEAIVPFFFKQWGGRYKRGAGRLLLGRTWDDMPAK